jgi:hypothetical protein
MIRLDFHAHRALAPVSKLEFLFMFFFVLVRVISWIVRYAAKRYDPRNHTKPKRSNQTSNSSFDTLSLAR